MIADEERCAAEGCELEEVALEDHVEGNDGQGFGVYGKSLLLGRVKFTSNEC